MDSNLKREEGLHMRDNIPKSKTVTFFFFNPVTNDMSRNVWYNSKFKSLGK